MSSPEPLCEALAGFTLVKFLVFYILANRFPNHRTARSSKPEYSTVFLEHGTLNAMFRLLNPKLDNLRISRYLVIMVTSCIIDLHNDCA